MIKNGFCKDGKNCLFLHVEKDCGEKTRFITNWSGYKQPPFGFIEEDQSRESLYFQSIYLNKNFPIENLKRGTRVRTDKLVDEGGKSRRASGVSLQVDDSK